MSDTFTILSKLLSDAPIDIQIIIYGVLKHMFNFRLVLDSMEEFISMANEKNKVFLTDRNRLRWVPSLHYEIMPMRFGFMKFSRHDHVQMKHREISPASSSPYHILLDAPDRLCEVHDTSKYYLAGIRIKSYPPEQQRFLRCSIYGFGDREKDKFVGDFMRKASLQRNTEMEGISLQDVRNAYNTVARTGEIWQGERMIRRIMDAEEMQINS